MSKLRDRELKFATIIRNEALELAAQEAEEGGDRWESAARIRALKSFAGPVQPSLEQEPENA